MNTQSKHSLNSLLDEVQGEDTEKRALSNRNINLVYYFILDRYKTILDISTSTGLPIEAVCISLQELRAMELLAPCMATTCKTTKIQAYLYGSILRKEGDDE